MQCLGEVVEGSTEAQNVCKAVPEEVRDSDLSPSSMERVDWEEGPVDSDTILQDQSFI